MRLVYFGSGVFGRPTLERLAAAHEIALVVTQPDRPAGRRRVLTPTPVAAWAAEHGLETIRPDRVNDTDVVDRVRSERADAYVVIAYGHKLGPALLDGVFAINLHASLLPKYRGAAPINWAMINGETETGVSVIDLASTMDAGDVYARRVVTIDPAETAGELHDRLAALGPDPVLETLTRHAAGTPLRPLRQDETEVSLAPKLTKEDGTVRFDQPAERVRCRIHGLTPWPGCTVQLADATLRLLRVEVVEHADDGAGGGGAAGAAGAATPGVPGAIRPDGCVTCAPGAVRLLSVQPPGRRPMRYEDYARGHVVHGEARMQAL